MKNYLKILGMALAISVAAGAQAGVIVYGATSDTASFNLYNSQSVYTSGSSRFTVGNTRYQGVTLDRFDSSLGTLTGVSIQFSSRWNHNMYGNSDDDSGWLGTVDAGMNARGTAQYGIRLVDPSQSDRATVDYEYVSCRDNDGFCSDSSSSGTRNFNGSLGLGNFTLAQFIGTDALNLNIWNYQDADITYCDSDGSDDCRARSSGRFSGDVTVRYRYFNEVPEPSSLALIGLGLVAVGFARRRRVNAQ